MADHSPAVAELERLAIPHRVFHHTGPIHSLEQAAAERGQPPEGVVRSIVFRAPGENGQREFLMVLVAGPAQISWPALRTYLGRSRLTMADEADLREQTGYVPGTVTPFGLPQPMRVLVDTGVLAQPEISLGSGVRGLAILLTPADLLRALELAHGQPAETGVFVAAA